MQEPTELDFAYMAGFFDGEGCISTHTSNINGMTITINITNTKIEVLEWIKERFEGSYILDKKSVSDKHKDAYTLMMTALPVIQKFVNSIYPYLIIKKPQADIAKLYFESRKNCLKVGGTYKEVNLLIGESLRRLNKKGK